MAKNSRLPLVLKGQRTFDFFDRIPSSEVERSVVRLTGPRQERFAVNGSETDKSLFRFCGTVSSTFYRFFRRKPKSRTTPYLI